MIHHVCVCVYHCVCVCTIVSVYHCEHNYLVNRKVTLHLSGTIVINTVVYAVVKMYKIVNSLLILLHNKSLTHHTKDLLSLGVNPKSAYTVYSADDSQWTIKYFMNVVKVAHPLSKGCDTWQGVVWSLWKENLYKYV